MLNVTPNRYGRPFIEWTADELQEHRLRGRRVWRYTVTYDYMTEHGHVKHTFEDGDAPTMRLAKMAAIHMAAYVQSQWAGYNVAARLECGGAKAKPAPRRFVPDPVVN